MNTNTSQFESIARQMRGRLVAMSHRSRVPHLGSALSCVDILVAAYWPVLRIDPQTPDDPQRDRFILSKGHAAPALYAALAMRGFFDVAELDRLAENGGSLPEQAGPGCMPGVEAATGSLGHGLSLGVGQALAGKIRGEDYRVWVLVSDGECNEGSVWEAAMFAPQHALGRLCVVVDFNKWQATGRSEEVMHLQPLADKWRAFGWETVECDGHDIDALAAHMKQTPRDDGKPTAIIAHTVKGKGVDFMEDDNNWHYRIPTEDEVRDAHRQLQLA